MEGNPRCDYCHIRGDNVKKIFVYGGPAAFVRCGVYDADMNFYEDDAAYNEIHLCASHLAQALTEFIERIQTTTERDAFIKRWAPRRTENREEGG